MSDALSPEVSLSREDDGIAVIRIDNPPVNALSQSVRAGLMAAVERIEADGAIKAAVLICAGRTFVAGADVREFGKPLADPQLPEIIDRFEGLDKPVVTAIHGTALGGGLELALGCHYRVLAPDAKVGLPEVTLGIIPGAGGTQRLPRLVGVEKATDMITSGKPISAKEALHDEVADAIAEDGLEIFAMIFARAKIGFPVPRVGARDVPPPRDPDFFSKREADIVRTARGQISPVKALEAVRIASETPLAEGLSREREIFSELRASAQSRALRHAFFAERAVAKVPEREDANPREIRKVGIVGGGTMGGGIATALLASGFDVSLVERDAGALDKATERVGGFLDGMAQRGRLDDRDEARQRFSGVLDYADLADHDLVIEAVFEDMEVKSEVFGQLDMVMRDGAILATNTSYLDVNRIAATTKRPSDVIGLHFFSPAHIMRLLEIVVADKTNADVVATGFALAKKLGKIGVRSGVCDGFIGNRMLSAYRIHADILLEEGALPEQIDQAMRDYGFAMGMYAVQDLAGLDISWANRKAKAGSRDPSRRYVGIADRLCEMGRFGQKTGAGWFRYQEGDRTPQPDPEVEAVIVAARETKGIAPRDVTADEIMERLLLAMINEGAAILDERIALRASDIDVVKINGYGFPRHKGGPMFQADELGVAHVRDRLTGLADSDPSAWTVSPLIGRLADEGRSFADLDKG